MKADGFTLVEVLVVVAIVGIRLTANGRYTYLIDE